MSISWIAGRFLTLCGVPGVEGKLGRLEDGQVGLACVGDGIVLRHCSCEAFSFSEEPGSGWCGSVCEATSREMKVVFGASALKLGTAFPRPADGSGIGKSVTCGTSKSRRPGVWSDVGGVVISRGTWKVPTELRLDTLGQCNSWYCRPARLQWGFGRLHPLK